MKFYGKAISQYLEENYCPTLDSPDCAHDINTYYSRLLVGEGIKLLQFREGGGGWLGHLRNLLNSSLNLSYLINLL